VGPHPNTQWDPTLTPSGTPPSYHVGPHPQLPWDPTLSFRGTPPSHPVGPHPHPYALCVFVLPQLGDSAALSRHQLWTARYRRCTSTLHVKPSHQLTLQRTPCTPLRCTAGIEAASVECERPFSPMPSKNHHDVERFAELISTEARHPLPYALMCTRTFTHAHASGNARWFTESAAHARGCSRPRLFAFAVVHRCAICSGGSGCSTAVPTSQRRAQCTTSRSPSRAPFTASLRTRYRSRPRTARRRHRERRASERGAACAAMSVWLGLCAGQAAHATRHLLHTCPPPTGAGDTAGPAQQCRHSWPASRIQI
jgi:hypothetical protein